MEAGLFILIVILAVFLIAIITYFVGYGLGLLFGSSETDSRYEDSDYYSDNYYYYPKRYNNRKY